MKTITHVFAAGIAIVSAFLLSPAGMALQHQYPMLAPIALGVSGIAAVYHTPKLGA